MRSKKLRISTFGFRIALFPLLLIAGGCRHEKKAERPAIPVRVEVAQASAGAAGSRYSANVQPNEQVSLAFKSAGYVREIAKRRGSDGRIRNLQQGDAVTRGAVLARVRETDYVEKVNQNKAQLEEARASFEKQRLDFERAKALYESKSLAKADFDGARTAYESAQAKVTGAKAQLDAAQIALADCALSAPTDAVVLARNIEEGTLASSGTVGFVLADTRSMKAVFGVPDVSVRDFKVGQPLTCVVEALAGARLAGRITAISPSADQASRVFDVEVTLPNPGGRLKSGMIATVETPRERAAGIATIPAVSLTAILKSPTDPGSYAVFVVSEDAGREVAKLRSVKLGEVIGNRIAVTSGLAGGERVIVTGATIVADGDGVRIIP